MHDLSEIVQRSRLLDRFGDTTLAQYVPNIIKQLAAGGIIRALRRGEDFAVVVGSHLKKDNPGIDTERPAELADEVHGPRAGVQFFRR